MKKITLLLVLVLTFLFSLTGVYAYTFTNFYDISDEWITYNYYSTYYGFRIIQYDFPSITGNESVDGYELSITIPESTYNIQTYGGVDSQLELMNSSHVVQNTYDLQDLLGTDLYGEIVINTNNHTINTPTGTYFFSSSSIMSFSINMMINNVGLPSGYYDYWVSTALVGFNINAIEINFYTYVNNLTGGVQLSLYDTQYTYYNIPNEVTEPTAPSNWSDKSFMGWIYLDPTTGDYTYYNFDTPITETMLQKDHTDFVLLAKFLGPGETDIGQPEEPDGNLPTRLASLLDIFGMNNANGYILLYTIIHLLFIGLSLTIKRLNNKIVLIIASIVTTITFMIFGMLPIYIIIPMILLYIVLFGIKITIKQKGGEQIDQ